MAPRENGDGDNCVSNVHSGRHGVPTQCFTRSWLDVPRITVEGVA